VGRIKTYERHNTYRYARSKELIDIDDFKKIKKVLRDKKGVIDDQKREKIKKELGDVLWYVAQISTELKLDEVRVKKEKK